MIKKFKLFELFDQTNIYDVKLVSINHKIEEGDKFDLYLYTFIGRDDTKYYIRISFFNELIDTEDWENFMTLDFMDEEQYLQNKDVHYEIKFKNTDKKDAVKVINTVFSVLLELQNKLKPWIISFDCTEDRYRIYQYCVEKFLYNYMQVNYIEYDKNKGYFYLYNQKNYKVSDNGKSIIRKDNEKIVYTGSDN